MASFEDWFSHDESIARV